MSELALTWAKVASVGGMALAVLLIVFRDVIKRNIFPMLKPAQAFRIIRLIVICTFLIACVGIAAWVYIEKNNSDLKGEQRFFEIVLDAITKNAAAAGNDEERARKHQVLENLLRDSNASKEYLAAVERISKIFPKGDEARRAQQKLQEGQIGPTVEMLRKVAAERDAEAAEAHYLMGVLHESQGNFDAALDEYLRATRDPKSDEKYFSKAVNLALNTGKLDRAEALLNSRLALAQAGMATAEQVGLYTGLLALAKWYRGRLPEAEVMFDRALSQLEGKPSLALAKVLNDSSPMYRSRGLVDISRDRLRKAAEIYACLVGETDTRYLNSLLNLAAVYVQDGSYGNAEVVVQRVLDVVADARASELPKRFLAAQAYVVRGNLRRAEHRLTEAEDSLIKALGLFEEMRATLTFSQGRAETYLGAVYLARKMPDEATKRLQNGLASNIRLLGLHHFETGYSFTLLAATSVLRGDLKEGRGYLEQADATVGEKMQGSAQAARIRQVEGELLLKEGRVAEAEVSTKKACQIFAAMPVPDPQGLSGCYDALGDVLAAEGRGEDAATARTLASRARAKVSTRADSHAVPKSNC